MLFRSGPLAAALRGRNVGTSLALATVMALVVWVLQQPASTVVRGSASFYALLPHDLLVGLFGSVFGCAALALAVGVRRFWRDTHTTPPPNLGLVHWRTAIRDAATLRNLHSSGLDCVHGGEERRAPWRRWFHHATFYGFALCFLSTTVAAIYHVVLGRIAPYALTSLPVVLGTVGGVEIGRAHV